MRLSKLSLKVVLTLGTGLLVLVLCIVQGVVLQRQTAEAMREAAQQRQTTSLRILIDQFDNRFGGIGFETAPDGTVSRVTWDRLPDLTDNALIDHVGGLSGETATLFAWDAASDDFVRVSTNIQKPDGTRAVGTPLGRDNPVRAAMLQGQTYSGEAIILGRPFMTVYQPIMGPEGQPIGIFYVGIDRSRIDHAIAVQRQTGLVVTAVLIALAMAVLLVMLRVLLRPLSDLGGAFERMAGGDLETEVPHAHRQDEIGGIADRADAFRIKLKAARRLDEEARQRQKEEAHVVQTLRAGLERMASGDLSRSLEEPFPENYEGLRTDFNATIDTLNDLIGIVAENAAEIRTRTDEISTAADELSHRTENQAATLEETAAALDQMTSSVRAAAEGAAEVAEVVKRACNHAEESGLVVKDAVGAMSRIKRSSDGIGQIIGVIDDIAFQTNLLALNAGVEAARAGEAGRGFAVVASEVRALAQRSSEAAREIKTLISTSSDEVESGVALVNRTGEALTDIVERVGNIAGLVADIAKGAEEQSVGLGEINVGVSELDKVTQQNAAMVEEATAASTTLNSDAATLERLVARFDLKRRPSAHGTAPAPARARLAASAPDPVPAAVPSAPLRQAVNDGGWQDF
ncbi:methyl-accepting chemotaxis protein [Rhodovulum kholense]|uniref:Methyl-accepting chemotaxis protein n=1 Tax=Rhodovulum kholense TaxID=453584 RepID=A0A8E2VMG0_9RHOB|nr:methyl-accepting chemotaxis protein [Rhodovulum kholense]PTW51811.1 methyl-accepting chemotaxis protein [Rhodovulum kholense]